MAIILRVTNATANEFPGVEGLPNGGTIKAGIGTVTEFDVDDSDFIEQALNGQLGALKAAGSVTYTLDADEDYVGDGGARVFCRKLVVGHADLTDDDTAQTITDDSALPAGAVLAGYRKVVATGFTGGGASAATVDVGFDGASLGDVLDDGQSVFAASTAYGAGTNALPLVKRDIGGKTLQAAFASTDANLLALTAGSVTFEVYFIVI